MKVFGHFRIFLGRNQKNVFCKPFAQFYYGHFKPSPRSLASKMCKRNNFARFPGADIRYGEVWRSPHHNHLWCGENDVRHTTKQQFELDFALFLISIQNSVRFDRFRHTTNFDEIRPCPRGHSHASCRGLKSTHEQKLINSLNKLNSFITETLEFT